MKKENKSILSSILWFIFEILIMGILLSLVGAGGKGYGKKK